MNFAYFKKVTKKPKKKPSKEGEDGEEGEEGRWVAGEEVGSGEKMDCVCVCTRVRARVCVLLGVTCLFVVPGPTRGAVLKTGALHGQRRNQVTLTTTLMTLTAMTKVSEVEPTAAHTKEIHQRLLVCMCSLLVVLS